MKKYILLILFFSVTFYFFSQNKKNDSLYSAYLNTKSTDSLRFNAYLLLGFGYIENNPDSSIVIFNELLNISKSKKLKKMQATCYSNLGLAYKSKFMYLESMEYTNKSLNIFKEVGDEISVAKSYNSLGQLYGRVADYKKAIECYLKNIEIYEAIGKPDLKTNAYMNIATVYHKLKEYDEALKYQNQCLAIESRLNDENKIANVFQNKSATYIKLKQYDSAKVLAIKAIRIYERKNIKRNLSIAYQGMVTIYLKEGNLDSALRYNSKSLIAAKNAGSLTDEANTLLNSSNILSIKGDFKQSKINLERALEIAKISKNLRLMVDVYRGLTEVCKSLSNFKEALSYYENYSKLKDSLVVLENKNDVFDLTYKFKYKEKTTADSLKITEERKLVSAQIAQERTKNWAFLIGLCLLAVFGLVMVNRYRLISKQKKIIEIKELETNRQKLIVAEKNKEITDSINYARLIQQSLLASKTMLDKNLENYFIFYKPKDIVSGDFYWAAETNEGFVIACVDCTGHGVPGAFMSLIGKENLDKAVVKFNRPGEILSELNKGVKKSLNQNIEGGNKDGMDAALLMIKKSLNQNRILYSGANRSLIIVRKGASVVEEIKATKQAIGGFTNDNQIFEQHEIMLNEGDTVYVSTDGYADQFGSDKNKKLTTKRFKELLLSIHHLDAQAQKSELESFFNRWKGTSEQLDDLLVIGIKV